MTGRPSAAPSPGRPPAVPRGWCRAALLPGADAGVDHRAPCPVWRLFPWLFPHRPVARVSPAPRRRAPSQSPAPPRPSRCPPRTAPGPPPAPPPTPLAGPPGLPSVRGRVQQVQGRLVARRNRCGGRLGPGPVQTRLEACGQVPGLVQQFRLPIPALDAGPWTAFLMRAASDLQAFSSSCAMFIAPPSSFAPLPLPLTSSVPAGFAASGPGRLCRRLSVSCAASSSGSITGSQQGSFSRNKNSACGKDRRSPSRSVRSAASRCRPTPRRRPAASRARDFFSSRSRLQDTASATAFTVSGELRRSS